METTLPARVVGPLWPANNRPNLYQVDVLGMEADFAKEKHRLFVPDDEVNVALIELRAGVPITKRQFDSADDVHDYITEPRNKHSTTIILIHQTFSWGELEISTGALQALFSHLDISPGFWPALKLFGCKENDNNESVGGLNEDARSDEDDSFEFSYIAKHVEEHGRPDQYDPWSIRQIGAAYKYDFTSDTSVFVFVNPCSALMTRLKDLTPKTSVLEVHRLVLATVTERWSSYLAYLDGCCADIGKRAVLSNSPKKIRGPGYDVCFSDSQHIQKLQDTIIRVSHMLDLNLTIFETLLASQDLYANFMPSTNVVSNSKSTIASILTLAAQTRSCKVYAENLLRRLDGSSILIRSILDAQALETLQASSRTTAELAALARDDAKKATQEARTLNTITILGFVYLPASFAATLLGTQYITIFMDDMSGSISIRFAREMWIFGILTVILLLATGGFWLGFERRNRLADRAAAATEGI